MTKPKKRRYREPRATNTPIGLAKGMIPRHEAIREIRDAIRALERGEMSPPKGLTAEECAASLAVFCEWLNRNRA